MTVSTIHVPEGFEELAHDYFVDLGHKESSHFTPVDGKIFITMLQVEYGEKVIQKAVVWLHSNPQAYSGMKQFIERLDAAIERNESFNVEDQKYMNFAVQLYMNHTLQQRATKLLQVKSVESKKLVV